MSRQRWFCRFCGAMTSRPQGVCAAHADLPNLVDAVPPDPLESLPVTAAAHTGYQCQACGGSGVEYPRNECPRCAGLGVTQAAPKREDMAPTKGTEA